MKKSNNTQQKNEASWFPSETKRCFAIALITLLFTMFASAQTPRNCREILTANPSAQSGVYIIDPDGPGSLPSMNCQCDMTTDGGGWMLVLNYNHLTGTNPVLKVFTDSLPLQNDTILGSDESNTVYWGHAGNALMNVIPFDEIRFYGSTSDHNRVINFKTKHAGTVSYFKTGIGSTMGLASQFTPLNGHNAYLPAAANNGFSNQGNYAMTYATFYTTGIRHWDIKLPYGGCSNSINRWEVDDFPCTLLSTFHQIWVRQSYTPPCSTITCTINPEATPSKVSGTGCNNGKIRVNLCGTFQIYPRVELYNSSDVLMQSADLPLGTLVYRFKNLTVGSYKVKVYDGTCCEHDFSVNVKCYTPTSCLSATNITATSAQLNWCTIICAVGYKAQYREQGTTAWTTKGLNTNTGTINLTGLQSLTTYEWHVGSKCQGWPDFNFYNYSNTKSFTTASLRMGDAGHEIQGNESIEINLYPNPATYTLTVNLETEDATALLKVVNTVGQVVYEKQLNSDEGSFEEQLDVSKLNTGVYMLLVKTEQGVSMKKFAKE